MIKFFIALLLLSSSTFAATSIDNKISLNKKILQKKSKQKSTTKVKIKLLAKQINSANAKMTKLEKEMNTLERTIKKQKKKLQKSKDDLKRLQLKSEEILTLKEKIQVDIIDFIINNYSSEIALKLADKKSLDEIVNSNVYSLLATQSKKEIKKLDTQYKSLLKNQATNKTKIKKLKKFIKKDLADKKDLSKLEKKHSKTIKNLKSKHSSYQKELKKIISKQKNLSSLLTKLNIMKKIEKKKAKVKKKITKKKTVKSTKSYTKSKKTKVTSKRFNEQIAMNVRSIGSSASGVRVTKYRGSKTISPLKKYTITKKFGATYDKVYKIKLFNDSISLKTKKSNAKVYSVLSGKVVYSKKDSGLLENVVIIKHKNNLHTIYSHLDKIAPTIRKGKWVKKGSVIGRVNDTLTFQATKNNRYINPKELF